MRIDSGNVTISRWCPHFIAIEEHIDPIASLDQLVDWLVTTIDQDMLTAP